MNLELTDRQAHRFEQIREELNADDPNLPEPSDEQVIDGLLDTWQAVNIGIYTEGHTPNDELRELIGEWRKRANETDSGLPGSIKYNMLHQFANQLSEVIQE
jgi:hypothetical protein